MPIDWNDQQRILRKYEYVRKRATNDRPPRTHTTRYGVARVCDGCGNKRYIQKPAARKVERQGNPILCTSCSRLGKEKIAMFGIGKKRRREPRRPGVPGRAVFSDKLSRLTVIVPYTDEDNPVVGKPIRILVDGYEYYLLCFMGGGIRLQKAEVREDPEQSGWLLTPSAFARQNRKR